MNDLAKAARQCEKIIARDFGGRCPKRVARNQRRAERMLAVLRAPEFLEEQRQAVIASAAAMLGFNCAHKPDKAAQAVENAQAIIDALPDEIVVRMDPPERPRTDMLKMGPSSEYIKAPQNVGPGPGYSKWMTLAALDLPDAEFDAMLSYMVSKGYGSCAFYIRSGQNMAHVFDRPDFDYWNDFARIEARCRRMTDAGIAPCPVAMSNDDRAFNSDWLGNVYGGIKGFLDRFHKDLGLVDRMMLAIELDKSWNNSLRKPEEVHKDFFGVRMVMDTLGGDAATGGLKTVHYPDVAWIGHFTHIWNKESGQDLDFNYAGPRDPFPTWQPGGEYEWFDVIYHQPRPNWGAHVNDPQALKRQQVTSYEKAIVRIRRDGAIASPFEYGQEPWVTETTAEMVGAALVDVSESNGLPSGFGTGADR